MKNNYLIVAALALVGVVAHAQVPYSGGDLIVGIQEAGDPNNLEIDLGNIGNFQASKDLGNISAALSSAGFTTGVSGVSWSVAGALGGANAGSPTNIAGVSYLPRTFWITQQQTTGAGIQGSSVSSIGFTSASGVNTNVSSVGVGLATASVAPLGSTGTFLGGALILPTSYTASYSNYESIVGGSNYGLSNSLSAANIEQTGAGSADLYVLASLTPGSVSGRTTITQSPLLPSYLGTFDLSSTGELSFTAAGSAIPEPSTYAMVLGAAALGFVMMRRRQQVLA
jgi:hypothetical protein